LVGNWEQVSAPVGGFTVGGITTTNDPYMGMTTRGTVASSYAKDLQTLRAAAIFYDSGGNVVGGAYSYLDFVPAGGSIGMEIHSMMTVPNVAKTDVYVGLSSLTLLQS
jgi:hypothetical protein